VLELDERGERDRELSWLATAMEREKGGKRATSPVLPLSP